MKSIKLPFGFNENNRLIHIVDAERGKKCNCVCPACGSLLTASKGSKNRPHFKHLVINECKGGFESAIHLVAKQMIVERREITLPRYDCNVSAIDSKGKEHTERKSILREGKVIQFDSVQEEAEFHGMRTDILAKKGDATLIIEIFFRHKVDDEKLKKMISANVSAIQIDLSDLTPEDTNLKNRETLWTCINSPQRVKWLHNVKAYAAYSELEKQLAKTIQVQEKRYKHDKIMKQKRERKEKEQLLQALESIEALSSKEYVEQLKQKALTHPFWKDNAQRFPFSWHELPYFIDVDIPNGGWIFGCDRRIWQIAFYKSFIWKNLKPFCVKNVDNWLQNKIGCKVHQSVKTVGIYGRLYPEIVSANIKGNLPSSWKTLGEYFTYLCELGILEFSGCDYHSRGNYWFKVIGKQPIFPGRCKRSS